MNGHRAFDEREGMRGHFRTLPAHFGEARGFGGHGPDGRGPSGPGFPRGGMPPHGGVPPHGGMPPHDGVPPFGGMPPHRPSPDFMKERIEEADLGELLAMAGRMARRRPQADPAQGQNLILSILAGREALSQRALQLMLGVQPGSLSEILTKLERKGLITREKAEDRRGNVLRITETGRAAIPEAEAPDADDRFSALTDEQQAQLAELLRTLLGDWLDRFGSEPPRPCPPDGGRFIPLAEKPERV